MLENDHSPSKWHVRLFGALEVTSPRMTTTGLRGTKAGALLAYLALHLDQQCSRESLAELFWPESDPASRRTRLRQELAALRTLFSAGNEENPGLLAADAKTISLRSEYIKTDVALFLADLREASRADDAGGKERLLEQAVERYGGDLAHDYSVVLFPERALYSQKYEAALRELAALLAAREAYADAEARLQQLTTYAPLLEEAHVDLMCLYARMGQPSKIRRQYQELEDVLKREVNAKPSESARLLFADLLRTTPTHEVGMRPGPAPLAARAPEAVSPSPADLANPANAARPSSAPEPPDPLPPAATAPAAVRPHTSWTSLSDRLSRRMAAIALLLLLLCLAAAVSWRRFARPVARPPSASAPPPIELEYDKEQAVYRYPHERGEKEDAEAKAVVVDAYNEVYAAGLIQTEGDDTDMLIVKLSSDLKRRLWKCRYSSPEHDCDRAEAMALGTDGALYVAGETYVPDHSGHPGSWHTVLLKLNPDTGKILWRQRSPEPSQNPGQRIYVCACPGGGASVGCTALAGQTLRMEVLRWDAAGALVWHQQVASDTPGDTTTTGLAVDSQGYIYACGIADRGAAPRGPNTDWLVVRFSPEGHQDWYQFVDGPSHGGDGAWALYLTNSQVRVTGTFDTGDPSQGGHGACLAAAELTPDRGKITWKSWDPSTGPSAQFDSCTPDSVGNTLVSGSTILPDGASIALLSKFDGFGHCLCSNRVPAPPGFRSSTSGRLLALRTDDIVLAGRISPGNQADTINADSALWLARLNGAGVIKSQWAFKQGYGQTYVQAVAPGRSGEVFYAGQAADEAQRHRFLVTFYRFPPPPVSQ